MKFDKAVNFFTFMIISLLAALQNGTAQSIQCISDQFTVYPDFLSRAGIIMNEFFQEYNLPVNEVSTVASYLTYARENLVLTGNIDLQDDLCVEVSRVCGNHLHNSVNAEFTMSSFIENKPLPFRINTNVGYHINPEHYIVEPKFSELLPKTTTIRCIPSDHHYATQDFFITKLSDSSYPIFIFKSLHPAPVIPTRRRTRSSTSRIVNEMYELAYEILTINDEVQEEVQISKNLQLPIDKRVKKETSHQPAKKHIKEEVL